MAPATSTTMIKNKSHTPARIEIKEVESPSVQAKQAIGVFDSGSGGMVAAAHLTRILGDANENLSVIFFGDTANLTYGKKKTRTGCSPVRCDHQSFDSVLPRYRHCLQHGQRLMEPLWQGR